MKECRAKNRDSREKSGISLRFRTDTAFFESRFEIRSLKSPLLYSVKYTEFHLNPSKNKETMKTFHFLSCRHIKVTIMTSYFRIKDDVIKICLNFTRFLPIVYSYQVPASSDLNQKKNCPFDQLFSQALPHQLATMETMNDLSPKFV